ncbi:MAG: peptide deformylase [Christensenellaceae bacterium]|jgi:peptide deformylase|nr:peptide deformylase [Christensenellaceae bacterium]
MSENEKYENFEKAIDNSSYKGVIISPTARLRKVLDYSDATLRMKTRNVVKFDDKLARILDDMKLTMLVENGCGLAGPQVGLLWKIAVVLFGNEYFELVNPVILEADGESIETEGCLSIPSKLNGLVARPTRLRVQYQNRTGEIVEKEFNDWLARIVCHEIDHLYGILFIDKLVK